MKFEGGERKFPWVRAMQIGLGELRLAPQEFWAMTPKELAHAAHAVHGAAAQPLQRAELARLIARYPDRGLSNGTD